MNSALRRALCTASLCLLLPACSPPAQGRESPVNTASGFPTLAAPASEAPASPVPSAVGTAPAPGTPLPTVIVMPQSQPIPLIGTGESDVEVKKWDGPALLHARYTGRDDFVVQGSRATYGDLAIVKTLINAMGPYEGTVPLDFEQGQPTTTLQVIADGPWVLEIQPVASAKSYSVPGTINGQGDEVVLVSGGRVGSLMAIAAGSGSFTLVGYTTAGEKRPLVDEIAPYAGVVAVDAELMTLAVQATGSWSLQIATK